MKKEFLIIFGTPHLLTTPGKGAPDGSIREPVYCRERIKSMCEKLRAYGYNVAIDYEDLNLPEGMRTKDWKLEQNRELSMRVRLVNDLCKTYDCIYVSVHLNAAGADGKWHGAGGWCAYTSPGKTKADNLAECLYDAAISNLREYVDIISTGKLRGEYTDKQTPIRMDKSDGDRDLEAAFYVLKHTSCPAVLTENLFQDNKRDVQYLLSDAGQHAIERLHIEGILNYIKKYVPYAVVPQQHTH